MSEKIPRNLPLLVVHSSLSTPEIPINFTAKSYVNTSFYNSIYNSLLRDASILLEIPLQVFWMDFGPSMLLLTRQFWRASCREFLAFRRRPQILRSVVVPTLFTSGISRKIRGKFEENSHLCKGDLGRGRVVPRLAMLSHQKSTDLCEISANFQQNFKEFSTNFLIP